ncbi:hypothetical protein AD930_06745 [Acetobacter malorum]|nr:hypothetical protein AD930_06745 [Acetobacter malorum]
MIQISWFLAACSCFFFLLGILLPATYPYWRIWLLVAALASFALFASFVYLHFSDIEILDDYLTRRRRSAEALSDIEREFQAMRDHVLRQKEMENEIYREFQAMRDHIHILRQKEQAQRRFEHDFKRHNAEGSADYHQPRSKYEEAMSILGLEHGFSQGDLKKAWKKKAFDTHPDHGGSSEKFQEVTDAYNFLRA